LSTFTDTFNDNTFGGFSWNCIKSVYTVVNKFDSDDTFNKCTEYSCMNQLEYNDICKFDQSTSWKAVYPNNWKVDTERKENSIAMTREATSTGLKGTFKLSDKFAMHVGWFSCVKGSNCKKLLLGKSSGMFDVEITGALSLFTSFGIISSTSVLLL